MTARASSSAEIPIIFCEPCKCGHAFTEHLHGRNTDNESLGACKHCSCMDHELTEEE